MTPPATAAALSGNRTARSSRRAPVRHPRRVSGPAGARAAAAVAGVAIPAPGVTRPVRRPARPVRRPAPARRTTRRSTHAAPGIALRAVAAFQDISASAALNRLIRGRAWIGLLAFALIGIVTMQLLVLELNTGIGHTLVRMATLQRQNAQLGIEDSMYSAESRVAPLAAGAGMALAPAGAVHFVTASHADLSRAAAALSAPKPPRASGVSEATGPSGGEVAASLGPAATSQAAVTETTSPTESSTPTSASTPTSGNGETRGEPGESTASSNPSTAASHASPPPASSAQAPSPSGTAAQVSGASAAPSTGSEASGSGGSVPAGPGR